MKKTITLGLVLSVLAVLGSIASISAGWGWPGVIVSVIIASFVFFLCMSTLKPILSKNARGVTLLQAIENVGLVDIENRDDRQHDLPPAQLYQFATQEIVMTGVSLYRTFDKYIDILHSVLKEGKRIYILILHPKYDDISRLNIREKKNISGDINQVITVIKQEGLHKHPGFKIKFFETFPTFTGVMIDGDIEPTGKEPRDHQGQIRVQPSTLYKTQHSGIIIHLRKKKGKLHSVFDYFAEDLRRQWKDNGMEDESLFL